jgi:hypothetical protein
MTAQGDRRVIVERHRSGLGWRWECHDCGKRGSHLGLQGTYQTQRQAQLKANRHVCSPRALPKRTAAPVAVVGQPPAKQGLPAGEIRISKKALDAAATAPTTKKAERILQQGVSDAIARQIHGRKKSS